MKADWALFRWATTYGYSQVTGSLKDNRVSSLIAKWSDVPSGTSSLELSERAWAGRQLENHYVLVRSVPDREEEREGGYVSRVLILPIDQATELRTLTPLFELLEKPGGFWETSTTQQVELEGFSIAEKMPSAVMPLLMTYAQRNVDQVVLLDSPQTPALLSGLWRALWPAARRELSFKTYFSPIQVPRQGAGLGLPLIISPSSAAKWEAYEYRTVASTAQADGSVLLRHLTGETSTLATCLLTNSPGQLTDLPGLSVLHLQIEAALTATDTRSVLVALDTLTGVPVAEEVRINLSDQLLQALSQRVPDLQIKELLMLNRFPRPPTFLRHAVESWSTKHLLFEPELPEVLNYAAENWFRKALKTGLAQLHPATLAVEKVWEHWPLLLEHDLLSSVTTADWDDMLAATLPQEPPADLRALTLQHRLLKTYAGLTGRQAHPLALEVVLQEIASADQVSVWNDLKAIWGAQNFVLASATLNAPALDAVVLPLLAQYPDLNQSLDPAQEAWRRWWTQRVQGGLDVWTGILSRENVLHRLLQLNPSEWPVHVMTAIAQTPQANLLSLPRSIRCNLWPVLPSQFLPATSRAWLEADASPENVEPEVLQEALTQIDGRIPSELAVTLLRLGLPLMSLLQLDLLLQKARSPWPEDLVALLQQRAGQGDLVEAWYDRMLSGRYSFPSGFFDSLVDRLSLMQQVRHFRVAPQGVPNELWWRALREKALATFGNELERVWADIGGKDKHLQHHGSYEDRWFHALKRMRKSNKPSFDRLLDLIGREDRLSDDSTVLWETRPHQEQRS